MEIKEDFTLLKNVKNYLNLSPSEMREIEAVENSARILSAFIKLNSNQFSHPMKDKIIKFMGYEDISKYIIVTKIPDYLLPVTINNRGNKQIIINLSPFNVEDISAVNPRTMFGAVIYGIHLGNL